jgi:lysophospholipase L1-like esterase
MEQPDPPPWAATSSRIRGTMPPSSDETTNSMGQRGRPTEGHDGRRRDLSELAEELQQSLGLENAGELLARVQRLSRGLWTPRSEESGPETFQGLVSTADARAVLTLLSAHGGRVNPWPAEQLAGLPREPEYGWRWEAAAVLVSGALALGMAEEGAVEDRERTLDTLLHVAFGTDDLSALTRRGLLIGAGDPWPPPFVEGDWPQLGAGCLMDIRSAGLRLASAVAIGRQAESTMPTVDANGITSLAPTSGSSGDRVRIFGAFPATARVVLFPRAGGGTSPATVTSWSTLEIEVLTPEPVGDGPVGFTDDGPDLDPSAAIGFAETLAGCLGRELAPAGGRLSGIAPGGLAMPRPAVPTLPGDVNVFHGGPILVAVAPASGAEPGPAATVTGENLRFGDTVVLDGAPGRTTFEDATRLTFTPPAIAAGNHHLQIRRAYRRSNGEPFDVRATLTQPPQPPRVPPGAYATLSGTGFGPTITATLDGAPIEVVAPDTHTLEVRTRRPSRPPRTQDRDGEDVSIEVFDRGTSLGAVTVTLDTFRIASFGDSIVWGQGLLETEKFTMLTADAVMSRRGNRIAAFALDRVAHSGAVIASPPGEGPAVETTPGTFAGECPARLPSITAQLALPALVAQRDRIDLVIIGGGINDVTVRTILDPFGSDAALSAATGTACRFGMAGLLATVRATLSPSVPIVVTGYYPIVSDQSDIAFLFPVLAGLGWLSGLVTPLVVGAAPIGLTPLQAAIIYGWVRQRLIDRSALFSSVANTALAAAVAGVPGAALAVPAFGPANSIFAPDSFLFGVGLSTSGLVPLDPVAGSRAAACAPGSLITTVASIGHPNAKGARAYADAIAAVLPRLGL